MGKKFTKILMASSNEVSLCSKYNSGANKKTEFEIIKDKEGKQKEEIKPVIEQLVKFADIYNEPSIQEDITNFKEFLNYWLEYDMNNTCYSLLSESLRRSLQDIQYAELTKEEKVQEYQKLFDMFIEEYKKLPITKTENGEYKVSLVSQSLIQDGNTLPQNETENLTKEKENTMENQEQMSVLKKAIEMLTSAFSLQKNETPTEEATEVQEEVQAEATEIPETVEVQAPVVEEVVEKNEEVVEEVQAEATEEVAEEETENELEAVLKAKLDLEKELAEIKKANEEKETTIEKMTFIQKAKDEYSMLVGTPEEIGERLYSISKSNLDETSKDFIMEQLKKVSVENTKLTEEVGTITKDAGEMTEEDKAYAKAEEIAKAKNISIKKALREVK